MLERIRDIRSSEKVLDRQVLDLYAPSVDYDPSEPTTSTPANLRLRPQQTFDLRLGDRFLGGIVLSMASQPLHYTRRLWGLPISILWSAA